MTIVTGDEGERDHGGSDEVPLGIRDKSLDAGGACGELGALAVGLMSAMSWGMREVSWICES